MHAQIQFVGLSLLDGSACSLVYFVDRTSIQASPCNSYRRVPAGDVSAL
jgi:hypothetical protein